MKFHKAVAKSYQKVVLLGDLIPVPILGRAIMLPAALTTASLTAASYGFVTLIAASSAGLNNSLRLMKDKIASYRRKKYLKALRDETMLAIQARVLEEQTDSTSTAVMFHHFQRPLQDYQFTPLTLDQNHMFEPAASEPETINEALTYLPPSSPPPPRQLRAS